MTKFAQTQKIQIMKHRNKEAKSKYIMSALNENVAEIKENNRFLNAENIKLDQSLNIQMTEFNQIKALADRQSEEINEYKNKLEEYQKKFTQMGSGIKDVVSQQSSSAKRITSSTKSKFKNFSAVDSGKNSN